MYQVPNKDGQAVPLHAFATWSYGITNDRVYRRNQYSPAMGIGYVVKQGYSYEQADAAIRSVLTEVMLPNNVFMTTDKDVEAESLQAGLSTPLLILAVIIADLYRAWGDLWKCGASINDFIDYTCCGFGCTVDLMDI